MHPSLFHRRHPAPLPLLAFCLLPFSLVQAAPWIDETFADKERLLQQPPASLAWFTSSASSLLTVSEHGLEQQGGGRFIIAHFTPPNTPLYLAQGETLVLTYEIQLKAPADSPAGLRVGLFSSAAAHAAHDGHQAPGLFTGYRGYLGACNPVPTKGLPLRLLRRIEGNPTLVNEITAYASIGNSAGIMQPMVGDTTYTGTFTIARSPSGQTNQITLAFSGPGITPHSTSTSDSDPLTVFDSVVFHSLSRCTAGFTLRSVRLELLPTTAAK